MQKYFEDLTSAPVDGLFDIQNALLPYMEEYDVSLVLRRINALTNGKAFGVPKLVFMLYPDDRKLVAMLHAGNPIPDMIVFSIVSEPFNQYSLIAEPEDLSGIRNDVRENLSLNALKGTLLMLADNVGLLQKHCLLSLKTALVRQHNKLAVDLSYAVVTDQQNITVKAMRGTAVLSTNIINLQA